MVFTVPLFRRAYLYSEVKCSWQGVGGFFSLVQYLLIYYPILSLLSQTFMSIATKVWGWERQIQAK